MVAPAGAVGEFANEYDEWHYLVGGLALGVLVGAVGTLAVVLAVVRLALAFSPHKAPDRNPENHTYP